MMTFNPRRVLETLAKHDVEYVVVGGIGGVLHGSPMSTDDVDIVPALRKGNLDSLAAALNEMNARLLSQEYPDGIEVEFTGKQLQRWIVDFRILNLMTDYGQLDLIHRPGGTSGYQDLAANSEELTVGDVSVRIAALEDIIRSKQAVARERDLEQLPTLRMLLEKKESSALRPGDEVVVPWGLSEARGDIVSIRGIGPAARVTVRVKIPETGVEEIDFPSSILRRPS